MCENHNTESVFRCTSCHNSFSTSFSYRKRKSICKLCESYQKHIKNNKEILNLDDFKIGFYERIKAKSKQPKDKNLFYCLTCNKNHSKEIRKARRYLCKDAYGHEQYNVKNNKNISFEQYMNLINKNNIQKEREFSLSELGQFKCVSCNELRPNYMKTKSSYTCTACRYYDKKNTSMSFEDYAAANNERLRIKNKIAKRCPVCFDVKDLNEFKTKSFCKDCWDCPDAKKIKQLRGVLGSVNSNYNTDSKFERFLGYSKSDLINNIVSKFKDGMSIDGLISGEIHIDHIIPVIAFNHRDKRQLNYCWSLNNLQPLWAKDNISKSDRLINGQRARYLSGDSKVRLLLELYGLDFSNPEEKT